MVATVLLDLIHLERGGDDFQEHGGLDRPARDAERVLGELEHVVPQPRLPMVLQLREIEVRATASVDELARVVEDEQSKVHEGASDRLAIHQDVFLGKVPSPDRKSTRLNSSHI